MASGIDSRMSVLGFLMAFIREGISRKSKLHKCDVLSTIESKYIAIIESCKEALWMKKFLEELGMQQEKYIVYSHSQSGIHLSKNITFHSKFKHMMLGIIEFALF